jgi:hypothetical protein
VQLSIGATGEAGAHGGECLAAFGGMFLTVLQVHNKCGRFILVASWNGQCSCLSMPQEKLELMVVSAWQLLVE